MAAGKQAKNDRETFKLVLGLKQVVITGLGLTLTLVWIFVLGVLVGKGEVGRVLTNWGLMTAAPEKGGIAPGAASRTPALPAVPPPAPSPESQTAAPAGSPPPAPVVSTVAPLPADKPDSHPAASRETASKPPKTGKSADKTKPADKTKVAAKDKPAKPKESVADRLRFLNSFGSQPKPAKTRATASPATPTASVARAPGAEPAAKSATKSYRVKIGAYRSSQEAQQALAELKKRGLPASLVTSKDNKGALYVIRTNKVKTRSEAEKQTQKLQGSRYQGGAIEETP